MNQQLVTIITPTYNRAHYLPETIESVLSQNYLNIQYIVLDDGSTDDTPHILARYKDRLRWERHPNMGEARTVNKGLRLAEGAYVCVVNSDDPILPGLVKTAVAFMEAQPDVLVAYPDWQRIDAASKPTGEVFRREYTYAQMLREGVCLVGPGAFIRRAALTLEPWRDPQYRYVSDLDYWLRLGLHGRFARIPRVLATHREHNESATVAERGEAMAAEHVQMIERLYSRADLPAYVQMARAESLANMYYMAAAYCLPENYPASRRYFQRSFELAPLHYLEHPKRLLYLLSVHGVPAVIHRVLYQRWQALKMRAA
ncbi:MAG: glycosyltransferase [Chloroflexi bacterium]|nr:glycosyltransferase [Chloroflexota bacterium]